MNKIKKIITKWKQKIKNKQSKYTLKEIPRIRQAQAIDYINEFCIGYYVKEHDKKPTIHNLDTPITKKFGLHSIATELLIDVMIKEKIITPTYDESGDFIIELRSNIIGFELYLNGGLAKKIKREKRRSRLIGIASIASVIVGIYYLVILLKELTTILYPLISN